MTTLRVLLLLAGAVFIVVVWWWSRRNQRVRGAIPARRYQRLPPHRVPAHESSEYTEDDEDVDFAETLADLSGLMREGREDRASAGTRESPRKPGHRRRNPQQIDMGFADANADPAQPAPLASPERVVALYVYAPESRPFQGPDIAAAFAAVDMEFGEMSIFHHYGVGHMASEEPLFSAANMFEPGTFNPQTLDDFETRGIAFFMRLPTREEASLTFELMLNTAQRLARELGGELRDDTHAPLASHGISQMRALVRQYDRA